MKANIKSKVVCETIEIDYENGFYCEYTVTNGKISNHRFYNDLFPNLIFLDNDTLDKIKDVHWPYHHNFIPRQKISKKMLETFTDFDKLYYVGCGLDGMTAHADGTFISTAVLMDDTFFKVYERIETSKEECQKILDSLNDEFIIDKKIVYIPYYNQDEDKPDHYTISLMVKLPDEEYRKILGSSSYIDSTCCKKIFELLKSKN